MTQTQQAIEPRSPSAAKAAWHEATEAAKIASIRRKTAQDDVDTAQQRIKNASENGNLTGMDRVQLADLGMDLARAMRVLDQEEAGVKRAGKEVKVAWSCWQPFANEIAGEDGPVRIPRVSHFIEAARRAARNPAGRTDPTIGDGPRTPKEHADAVLAKPMASLKAMQQAAAENGFAPARTVATGVVEDDGKGGLQVTAVMVPDRTDLGKPAQAARAAARAANLARQKALPHYCVANPTEHRFATRKEAKQHEAECPAFRSAVDSKPGSRVLRKQASAAKKSKPKAK